PWFRPTLKPSARYSVARILVARVTSSTAAAISSGVASASVPTWRFTTAMRCPGAYGKRLRMRNARSRRARTRLLRSSEPESAAQNAHRLGVVAAPTYLMRHGAQRRFTRSGSGSAVDEFSEPLSYLEERHAFLRDVHARPGLGVAPLPGVAVTDSEAAEASELDLVPLRQGVGDVVDDRVDDRFRLSLGRARDIGKFVDEVGRRHHLLPSKLAGHADSNPTSTLACCFRECQPS